MKTLRQLCASALLMRVLTLPALGGDIHSPVTAPPPQPPTATQPPPPPSDGDAGDFDPLTEAAILMLQGVLALF